MKKNKYEQTIDDTLDLHGMISGGAELAVSDFLNTARLQHFHTVLIITGKGLNSSGEPVLKNLVQDMLRKQNVSFRDAKIQEGGSGALVVKID